MKNAVVIRGSNHGITVSLDGNMEFQELLTEVKKKFQASAKFFGNADMAVSFDGRKLSEEEEKELTEAIEEASSLQIVCILDQDKEGDIRFVRALQQAGAMLQKQTETSGTDRETASSQPAAVREDTAQNPSETEQVQGNAQIYCGTMRSGQIVQADSNVVVLGDVNPGASVMAGGSVIVLGSLRGNVIAGTEEGSTDAFVLALEMNPMQITIGEVIARSEDSAPHKRSRHVQPQVAYVEKNNIYIEDLSQKMIDTLKIN